MTIIKPRKLHNMDDKDDISYNILVDDGKYILWRNERYIRHAPAATSPVQVRTITCRRSALKPPSSNTTQHCPWNRRHSQLHGQLFPPDSDDSKSEQQPCLQAESPVKCYRQEKTVTFDKYREVYEF